LTSSVDFTRLSFKETTGVAGCLYFLGGKLHQLSLLQLKIIPDSTA